MKDDFFRELLDNLYDGVYYVDRDRVITYWNKAAERLTGYTAEEVVGHACSDNILVHIDSDGCSLCLSGCPLHATMTDGQRRESFAFLHHKNGHRVPVHMRVTPLYDAGGEVVGGIEVFSGSAQSSSILQEFEQLKKESYVDPLLEIGNRRYAEMVFQTRLYELKAFNVACGVILLDVDNFKQINDTHGHPAGDRALTMVSRSVASALRQVDSLIRWGGDEILIFLPNVTEESLRGIAERIRLFVESSFIMVEEKRIAATVSVGVTFLMKNDSLESVIKRTDALLYESKQDGRNTINIG